MLEGALTTCLMVHETNIVERWGGRSRGMSASLQIDLRIMAPSWQLLIDALNIKKTIRSALASWTK